MSIIRIARYVNGTNRNKKIVVVKFVKARREESGKGVSNRNRAIDETRRAGRARVRMSIPLGIGDVKW